MLKKKYIAILFFLFINWTALDCQTNTVYFNNETKDSIFQLGMKYMELVNQKFQIDYDTGIYYAQKALDLFQEIEAPEELVGCNNLMAVLNYYKRDFTTFKYYAFHAIKLAKENLSPESQAWNYASQNLGGYYKLLGDYDKAINHYKNSLRKNQSLPNYRLNSALILRNISSFYILKGDYETASYYSDKALRIQLDSLPETDYRPILTKVEIAKIHRLKGNYDKAMNLLNECNYNLTVKEVPIEGHAGSIYFRINEDLSEIHRLKKEYKKTEKIIADLIPKYKSGNTYKKAYALKILGDAYIDQKKYNKSVITFKKMNQFLLNWYKEEKRISFISESFYKLAFSYCLLNKPDEAIQNIQSAISHLTNFYSKAPFINPKIETLPKRTLTLNILLTKSDILHAMWMESKENAEILQHAYDQYIYLSEFIHQLRFDLLSVKSKQLISEKIVRHFEKAIDVSLALYQQTNDPKHLEQAYHFAEQNKAITLQESIQENLAKGFGGIPDTTLEIEKDMRLEIAFYEKQIYEEKLKGEKANEEHLKTFESTLFDLKRDYERLVEQLEKEYPKYYELKYKTELPKVAAIQAKLSNGSALIEFFSGEETIYAFVFTKEQLEVIELPKAAGLTEQISRFKDLINNPPVNDRAQKDFQDFTQMGFDLFENILQKPLSLLPKSIQQLIVIPDGELTYIPFEVLLKDLPDKERVNYSLDNLSYLMEDYQVSYSFSSKLWLKNMGQLGGQAKEPFLGFAPVFGQAIADARRDCSADELYSLNCNKEEINTVHDMFGGHVFTDLAASKDNFEDQASNYQILHLATHACLDDENPMFNKIWLSDDYVSNNDLYNLSLNADLAVLSACNTGSGQLVKGEGVQSLARGFLHAGCPSLVTSLWSVDDCATSDIMIRFYEHLKEGNTKNKALQLAKLDYLKEADKLHQHPYYWSAFIQIGNPIALDFVGLNWTFIFVGLGILIVLFFLLKRKSKIEI